MFGPNISGEFEFNSRQGAESEAFASGPFTHGTEIVHYSSGGNKTAYRIKFDASLADGLFGDSSTVQPSSVLFLPCIKS